MQSTPIDWGGNASLAVFKKRALTFISFAPLTTVLTTGRMQQPPQQRRRRHRHQSNLGMGLAAALVAAAATGKGAAAFEAPPTPVLSSIINPAIDRCTADPAGWVKGPVPAPESVTQVRAWLWSILIIFLFLLDRIVFIRLDLNNPPHHRS